MPRLSLRRLLPRSMRGTLVLLLLLVVLAEAIVQVIQFSSAVGARRDEVYQDNLEVARALAGTFDNYVRATLRQELALGIALTTPQPLPRERMSQVLAAGLHDSPGVTRFSWVSPRGTVIASSEAMAIGFESSDSPFFDRIVGGQEWVISDLVPGQISSGPVFLIARGVRDPAGTLQGIVVAVVNPDRLDEVLGVERAGQAAVAIIDSRGRAVYRYPEIALTWDQRNWIATQPIIGDALAGHEATGMITPVTGGGQRLASFTPIRSIGWVATASRTEQESLAPLIGDLLQEGALRLLVAVIAVLAALTVGRYITVPLRRLCEYALAVGRGHLGGRVEVAGPSELEALANAFNRMAEEIGVREEEREAYVHTISHDLRAPLTIILGQAQILKRQQEKAGATGFERRGLEAIITSCRRMNTMISDLVDAARIESGQIRLAVRPVDLRTFVVDLKERMAAVGGAERIRIDFLPSLPPVSADPDRLERILMNLLTNALAYSAPGSTVAVTLARRNGEVVTAVSDRGPGIPPGEVPHLFDRFYRTRAARGRKEGLGLGLYITKGLVEAHGGRIWVESQPGVGSTFYFSLPVVPAP